MANHVMFRSDNLAGTTQGKYLVSIRIDADIDNGMLVTVGPYETGAREVRQCSPIAATTEIGDIAVLGSEEVNKEVSFDTVNGFTNKKGSIARGYVLEHGDCFSVTAGAFSTIPTVGATIYAEVGKNTMTNAADDGAASGKVNNVKIGKCEAIEKDGATTWYVIRVA